MAEVLGWGDRVIALGTVIDTARFVLTAAAPAVTKTAYCPEKLRCRLASGRAVAATVVGSTRPTISPCCECPDLRHRDSLNWDVYPPFAMQGDLPILQNEHGCPVVGQEGDGIGTALGRVAPQACVIIAADGALAHLADLNAGKPLASLPCCPFQGTLIIPGQDMLSKFKSDRKAQPGILANQHSGGISYPKDKGKQTGTATKPSELRPRTTPL